MSDPLHHLYNPSFLKKTILKTLFPFNDILMQVNATYNFLKGMTDHINEFLVPFKLAGQYFTEIEKEKLFKSSPYDNMNAYIDLMDFNLDLSRRGVFGSLGAMNSYGNREIKEAFAAFCNTLFNLKGADLETFIKAKADSIYQLTNEYPQVIRDIEPEFGFHFERRGDIKIAETDRFILYQVLPTEKNIVVDPVAKPIIILPPYVLGANILAFLPNDQKSYTHCFANQGIPTYIRIMKDIEVHEGVQRMTFEEDVADTRFFCDQVLARHGKKVTLNGYCQGGFIAVCGLLTGELDHSVDALLTCVSPMDGTRGKGLSTFLQNLPQRFNDIAYGTKKLRSGHKVADGRIMSWVYKLKSIEIESPLATFFRNLTMLRPKGDQKIVISKTAAALNFWLNYDRTDLPLAITQMSFDSYTKPITKEGVLPVTYHGRELNFKRLQEKKIKWLICYGESDDLVEKETALAPLDYVHAELAPFPKGHVAIATSWANPKSAYALHTRFGDGKYRGPVRFQMDLDKNYGRA